ncbi:MAG: TIGR03032 family protein [Rhodopila sp.]|nr:TIGR03032 family protein [Rhodopila sp.]
MTMPADQCDPASPERLASLTIADPVFIDLLEGAGISLIASLRPGHIACFGASGGRLIASFTPMRNPLGLATDGSRLAIGTRRQIVVYTSSTRLASRMPGQQGRHDAVFVPVASFRTGECMVHDMALDGTSVVFANTQFSCLSRADGFKNFVPLWQPPFISALLPEDRCHLNSFAMDGRRIRYATAFAPSDAAGGHRNMPSNSGIIIDVEANAVVATGLLKPHSVRVFDGELYVLNSAAGEVMRIDLAARDGQTLARLPGFTRGLRAHGDVLFVGLSTLRATAKALDLPLMNRTNSLMAGIAALDRRTGEVLGMLRLPAEMEEVFDFVIVPGIRQALVMNPEVETSHIGIETTVSSYWMTAVGEPATPA